ncbi:hypothetical protein JANAI62_00160 [Jannaschia pagri]|uniref:Uncharacterized protein n=1 Tax=Jannaschia pagri TaxID=2829797 RepID=A0ABQ4NG57_9RHOB|nr:MULTISPECIES: hypothetical protein [unclassified Jannaschia]GIT90502.1 hypothetical protein JANAI61_09600 [Jannaschia sp. AI_61]GIT93393.1 hypothetical protein JANAI62_00160 [Jannaschia sp. AI_62]
MSNGISLTWADAAAVAALTIALPYTAGFAYYAAFFTTFDVALSEVNLSQGDYFLQALNVATERDGTTRLPLWAVLLCLAGLYGCILAVLRTAKMLRTRHFVLGGVAGFAALLLLALTAGQHLGRSESRDLLSGDRSLHPPLLLNLAAPKDKQIDLSSYEGLGARRISGDGVWRLIFADGQTLFLLGQFDQSPTHFVLRLPVATTQALVTTVPEGTP